MRNYLFITSIGIVLGLIAFGVEQRQQEPRTLHPGTVLRVTASFYPLAEFAAQVGGDLVSVTNLTPAGSEPHDFDPSPKDIAELQRSNVFVYNGTGLEPWVIRTLPDLEKTGLPAGQAGMTILNATRGVPLIPNDPHIWLSPKLAEQQTRAIAKTFGIADSSHAALYARNADAYIAKLEQLHKDFQSGTAQCKRREIITSHAAFTYLAREYGLTMVSIAGISPDAEPSPARLAEISKFVQEHGVTHIFFETLVSPALSKTIAKETGTTASVLHTLEGLTEEELIEGKSYISVQRENLSALRTALDCI